MCSKQQVVRNAYVYWTRPLVFPLRPFYFSFSHHITLNWQAKSLFLISTSISLSLSIFVWVLWTELSIQDGIKRDCQITWKNPQIDSIGCKIWRNTWLKLREKGRSKKKILPLLRFACIAKKEIRWNKDGPWWSRRLLKFGLWLWCQSTEKKKKFFRRL